MRIATVGTISPIPVRVGIYNEIPDDSLVSYKSLIEEGFNSNDHTVDAVVDTDQYSPCDGKLKYYLSVILLKWIQLI